MIRLHDMAVATLTRACRRGTLVRVRLGGPLVLFSALLVACQADVKGAEDVHIDLVRDAGGPVVLRDAGGVRPTDGDASAPDAAMLPDAGPPAPVRWFEDVTLPSITWARVPAEGMRTFPDRFSGGVCVIDVDGVTPMDLFFTSRGAGSSRLFVGSGRLAWTDRTVELGLGVVGDAMGCLAFDAEGDGDDDLLVTLVGGVELYLREGDRFVSRTAWLGARFDRLGMYTSAAAGDLDGDGDLDLVIGAFERIDQTIDPELRCLGEMPCTADINRHVPIANVLLLREPDGRYADRTAQIAPPLTAAEATLLVQIGDFLETGKPAIYVGNDLGGRFFDRMLQRRPDGTFEDVALSAGFATNARGYGIDSMGFASGDLDRDGALEHAATSYENDATAIFDCYSPGVCEDRGTFLGTRAAKETFRWGNAFVDVNLDGWPDLIEATGHYMLQREVDELALLGAQYQRPNLLMNLGDGHLVRTTPPEHDGLAVPRAARGIARTDFDDDGRVDIVLATAEGAPAVLHNVHPPAGRWLRVVLQGRAPNTRAVGAQVRVELDRGALLAEQRAGEGYLGSFDPRLFFGLGPAVERVNVMVRWPSGVRTRLDAVGVDRELVIREP